MKRIFLGSLGIGTLGFILFAIPLLDAQQQGPPGGFPPPPVLQAIDKDGDGTISEQELAQAPAALRSIDKNSDGKLAGDEIVPDFGPGFGGRDSVALASVVLAALVVPIDNWLRSSTKMAMEF